MKDNRRVTREEVADMTTDELLKWLTLQNEGLYHRVKEIFPQQFIGGQVFVDLEKDSLKNHLTIGERRSNDMLQKSIEMHLTLIMDEQQPLYLTSECFILMIRLSQKPTFEILPNFCPGCEWFLRKCPPPLDHFLESI